MNEYEVIQQRIEDVETAIGLAEDIEDVLGICVQLVDLIRRLEQRTAPQ